MKIHGKIWNLGKMTIEKWNSLEFWKNGKLKNGKIENLGILEQ